MNGTNCEVYEGRSTFGIQTAVTNGKNLTICRVLTDLQSSA
ncbi:hypothetical protein Pan216_39100 [Planctomycetes bacterium Pan216]|uniref:Uncharacterized protein n=1 Tax=Kolteria novifilia TaxID=2527975 RepID=A0A518B7T5_9BACT|nr:hypothetical protein Pan216_39100 [Planctomycetes bacterium Pan216]